jgi:tetratricopeptide (TPR) repeat protein
MNGNQALAENTEVTTSELEKPSPALVDVPHERRRALTLAQAGHWDEAIACWRRLSADDSHAREAAEQIARLVIRRSRQQAGLDTGVAPAPLATSRATPQKSPAAAVHSPPSPPSSPAGSRSGQLTPIQQLEAAIRDQPTNALHYVNLTRLYLEKGRDYEAERLLLKARDATDRDPRILTLSEDVTLERMAKKLAAAERDLQSDDSPPARSAVEQILHERDRLEVEIFTQRTQRDPDNLGLKYQLGIRLKRAGKVHQARRALEESLADAQQRAAAAFELGECARADGQIADALRYYRLASNSAADEGSFERREDALLFASKLAGQIKLWKLARRYVKRLLQMDPSHLGAAALLAEAERQIAAAHAPADPPVSIP